MAGSKIPLEIEWYLEQNIPVFALWGTRDGVCRCPDGACCDRPGKHPQHKLCPHGYKDATLDREVILGWLRQDPTINWGARQDALDWDDSRGLATREELESDLGPLSGTRIRTQGEHGGYHDYTLGLERGSYQFDDKLPGLDMKFASTGYVVTPPSVGQLGTYTFINKQPPALIPPAWWEYLNAHRLKGGDTAPKKRERISQKRAQAIAADAFGRLITLAPGVDNGRNNVFFQAVKDLARLNEGGFIERTLVENRLWQIADWLQVPGARDVRVRLEGGPRKSLPGAASPRAEGQRRVARAPHLDLAGPDTRGNVGRHCGGHGPG